MKMTDQSSPPLEHPLPEEIQKMARDETVCKFCGVSYLIHNEIKALEDKLRAAEKELAHFRGMEKREETLKETIQKHEERIKDLEQKSVLKDSTISTLESNLKERDENWNLLDRRRQELERLLCDSTQKAEMLSNKHQMVLRNLPNIQSQLRNHTSELIDLNSSLHQQRATIQEECSRVQNYLLTTIDSFTKERETLTSTISELQQGKEALQSKEDQLQRRIQGLEADVVRLKSLEKEATSMKYSQETLHSKIKDLEGELEVIQNQNRNLSMEAEQYKEQQRTKSNEIESLLTQLKHKDTCAQQIISRMERKMQEKEEELFEAISELKTIKSEYSKQQRQEEEMKRKASQSTAQTTEMSERLERCLGDMEALKNEREMMITAHQNQIEQLRESFKRRISEADGWPQKLDDALKSERQKHAKEIGSLEAKLKENFTMEIEIERQKHQKLLEKSRLEKRELERELRAELSNVAGNHQGALTDLHKQLAETKARSRETENMLRSEISSLKGIIKDLEGRLGKLDAGNDVLVSQLKAQLREAERQMEETKQVTKSLQTQWTSSKEEILFLQDTVRKECEERFELTEALSVAKEELLSLKRPPGGYSNGTTPRLSGSSAMEIPQQADPMGSARSSPGSSVKSSSSRASVGRRSEEMMLFRKSSAVRRAPHPPQSVPANPPNVGVSFDGDEARATGRGVKGSSMTDSRRRISQAVGRP